jgi:hypothetical protein
MSKSQLTEGLRYGDLKGFVADIFTVDHYKSKMGEDRDVVVIGFRVKEKHPAMDLMEFIEKGYKFILDGDMSAGEEQDGQYQVFVEIERTPNLPGQLRELLSGVAQVCGCYEWKFRYHKTKNLVEFSEQTFLENVPLTPADYEIKILETKNQDIREFFDQGATSVSLDQNNILTFSKPFAGDIQAKFLSIGDYDAVKEILPGPVSLDEASQSQTLFLNKYLGNYEIHKISEKFLIRNGKNAVIIEKTHW